MFRNGTLCLFYTSLEETLPWCELNSHLTAQCHLPQGSIRSRRAKDTLKPRFGFLFQKGLGKKSPISLQEGLVGYFASETPKVPAPASPLRHKALWGLSAERKLPQISKTGLKADGRPLKFHSPGFCEYLSLETDHSNTGRFSRRTKLVGLIFIERQPRSLCLSCLLKQAEGKIMTS